MRYGPESPPVCQGSAYSTGHTERNHGDQNLNANEALSVNPFVVRLDE